MKSVKFDEVTNTIGEGQEEYQTVHSCNLQSDSSINLCFELSDEEIETLKSTKKIWYKQVTFGKGMSPMSLSVDKSEVIILDVEIIKG
jgi:hypothetical protein